MSDRTDDDRTDPTIGGDGGGSGDDGSRVRDAAPDSATETADEVSHSVLAVEKTVLVASVVITVLLLGFLAYSAVTTPETAPPTVEVAGATEAGNDTDRVRVALTNHGGTGLEKATVAVECGNVSTETVFENVPATSTATGVVVCPTGAERNVTVRSWRIA